VKRQGLRYSAVALLCAALVLAVGVRLVPAAQAGAVITGSLIALVVQVGVFWLFMVRLFPGRGWHGYGLGLLVRFAAFAVVALLLVPMRGMPLGATLFPLAAVFWLTTMLEPLFLKARTPETT
jgi:hypothetical protein